MKRNLLSLGLILGLATACSVENSVKEKKAKEEQTTTTITPTPTLTPAPPSQTPTPVPSIPASPTPVQTPQPTPELKTGSLVIEGNQSSTKAPVLKLEMKFKEGLKMKISETSDCSSGQWEPYSPQKLWSLTRKNQWVSLSVMFQDYEGISSACTQGRIFHDDLPPSIQIIADASNTYELGKTSHFQIRITDSGMGLQDVRCQLNSDVLPCQVQSNGDGDLTIPNQSLGTQKLVITGEDKLGNTTAAQTEWTVQKDSKKIIQTLSLKSQSKVDILLITDNSVSMEYEQSSMARRMGTFISKLAGLDWRIGVITTDPRNATFGDGRLLPMQISPTNSVYYIESSLNSDLAQSVLGDTIQRPEKGSSSEQGIYSTYRLVERSLDPKDKIHSGFLRSDAAFATVVISDEDESASGYRNQPANLIQLIQTRFQPKKKFVFHSIITKPGDQACAKSYGDTYGNTYAKLSNLTGAGTIGGAIIGSVCEADYAGQLNGIGQSIQDMRLVIDLQCAPLSSDPSSIQVDLNGKPYLERFQIQGQKLVFEKNLPGGEYRLEYECKIKP